MSFGETPNQVLLYQKEVIIILDIFQFLTYKLVACNLIKLSRTHFYL